MTIARPTLMVAIGTHQALPNFITAQQLKPDGVVIVCSDNDKAVVRHTHRVKEALASIGIPTRVISGLPSSGHAAMLAFLQAARDSLQKDYPDARYQLNITGGTKVMALAALQVFAREPETSVVYLDTAAGQLEYLQPEAQAPVPLQGSIPLRPFLKLHGFTVETVASDSPEWRERVELRQSLTNAIAKAAFADQGKSIVSLMNATSSQFTTPEEPFLLRTTPRGAWEDILKKSHRLGLVDWDGKRSVRFVSEEAARYFNGLWLEEYIWSKLAGQPGLDVHCSVKGYWGQDGADSQTRGYNELDIMVLKDNRLHVLECKTGDFSRKTTPVTEVLAKLRQMAEACGGSLSEAMLVSFQEMKTGDITRANEIGVRVFHGQGIRLAPRFILNPPKR